MKSVDSGKSKMNEIRYKPIGIFKCEQRDPLESPRQGVLAEKSRGVIELNNDFPLECLRDLSGFERVWLIYDFHLNKTWKPFVRPPRGTDIKRGVLSTRSPYRPNSIGLTCVRLGALNGNQIEVFEHDLLDDTPLLDIKPYLPYADSFSESKMGWIDEKKPYPVEWTKEAAQRCEWLNKNLNLDISTIVIRQLEFEPTQKKIKRVKAKDDHYIFSYKTWRFSFYFDEVKISLFKVESGYSSEEMIEHRDPYNDKAIHRNFNKEFNL